MHLHGAPGGHHRGGAVQAGVQVSPVTGRGPVFVQLSLLPELPARPRPRPAGPEPVCPHAPLHQGPRCQAGGLRRQPPAHPLPRRGPCHREAPCAGHADSCAGGLQPGRDIGGGVERHRICYEVWSKGRPLCGRQGQAPTGLARRVHALRAGESRTFGGHGQGRRVRGGKGAGEGELEGHIERHGVVAAGQRIPGGQGRAVPGQEGPAAVLLRGHAVLRSRRGCTQ
mmetsp:Transcript_14467/g.45987  ORF Transcript_14467/g.45987 Transcript_14467/m.45987 type:complete len:226 (-) Transcript_14467:624-1301(-)